MEQFFNFGSKGLQNRLVAEQDSFDEIVGELTGVKPKGIHPLFTWNREHSAMHEHVEKFCDEATREGVDAMIRQRCDGFLQNHIFCRVFPEANKFINGVPLNENFEANRASSDTITALIPSNNYEAIRKELTTFNHLSQHTEEYVRPPNDVLREGYERAMLEEFASIIQEMKTTGETKTLVVIEREYLKHLSEEFRETHLTSCFSERLFMKKTNGATIYVLVTVSYHVIAGACIHNQSTRNQQYCRLTEGLKSDV
jgi:hypothetical protein